MRLPRPLLCACVLAFSPARAAEPIAFDLPAQPLAASLDALASQAHLQLVYPPEAVRGLPAPALSGRLAPEEALARLLAGTGLEARFTGEGAVAIVRAPPAGPASGQASPQPQRAELEEVAVTGDRDQGYAATAAATGTRTDTPLIETPVSVQVVPREVLTDQGSRRVEDALANVSGVIPSDGTYHYAAVIRGFGNNGFLAEDGAKVDQYAAGTMQDLANVERVEVLKGPASILYGRGEPGGLISVVTKKPLDHPAYALEQQVGSFATYRTTLDATGPVTEGGALLYRLNLAWENAGSFRDFVRNERLLAYPTLQWKADPATQVTLEGKVGHGREPVDFGLPTVGGRVPAGVPRSANFAEPGSNRYTVDEYSVRLGASYELESGWTLRGFAKFEEVHWPKGFDIYFYNGEPDPSGLLARIRQHVYSSNTTTANAAVEATGAFATGWAEHTLLAGADWLRIDEHFPYNFDFAGTGVAPIDIHAPVYGQPLPPLDPAWDNVPNRPLRLAYGLFLQDQVKLPHGFHLLAGVRWDRALNKDRAGATITDHPPLTPRAGVLWQAVPALGLYASYTENFGASAQGQLTWDGSILPAESAQQWEAGLKAELLEKRVTGTLAAYRITKQNVLTADPAHDGFVVAIGEVLSKGVELDLAGELAPGWSATVAYAWNDVRITRDNFGNEGKPFPVPHHSASLWTTWAVPGALRGLKVGGGVVARSSQNSFNDSLLPGYWVARAFASHQWSAWGSRVTAQLNVDNLLDRTYQPNFGFPGAPRSFTGSLRLER